MSTHVTIRLEENDEGWWEAICQCNWYGGLFPTAEDAADALMDHAYTEGIEDTLELAKKAR